MTDEDKYSKELEVRMHQTIKKVTNDFEALKYNTAIAAMMSLINDFYKAGKVTKGEMRTFLTLLNPVAPHITEELWEILGFKGRIYNTSWPVYEEGKTVEDTIKLVVQVNGKTRAVIDAPTNLDKDSAISMGKEAVSAKLTGNVVKEIYVPGKLVNFVMK